VAAAVAVAGIAAGVAAASEPEPGPAREQQLLHLLTHDCGSCHGLTMKGGLGPPLVPDVLAGKPDQDLTEAILAGRPGTPMPPWAFAISEAEAAWLVARLRRGALE
jgi:cytochrome c55X